MTPPQLLARAGQNAGTPTPQWQPVTEERLRELQIRTGPEAFNREYMLSPLVERMMNSGDFDRTPSRATPIVDDLLRLKRRLIADAMWDDVLYAANPPANTADCAGKEGE